MSVLCETVDQTKTALVLWGEYIRSDVPVKKYGCSIAIHRGGREWGRAEEEQALLVDHLVARLRSRDPIAGKAVELYYAQQCNIRQVAKRLGISLGAASGIVQSGVYWISGAICTPSKRSLELMARLGLEVMG